MGGGAEKEIKGTTTRHGKNVLNTKEYNKNRFKYNSKLNK